LVFQYLAGVVITLSIPLQVDIMDIYFNSSGRGVGLDAKATIVFLPLNVAFIYSQGIGKPNN
jgi:hypothetical protein